MTLQATVNKMSDEMEDPRDDLPPQSTGEAPEQATEPTDVDGRSFNPDIHEYDMIDGQRKPRITTRGNLRKKRGLAKVKSKIGGIEDAKTAPESIQAPPPMEVYQASGQAVAETIFVLCKAIGGPDWEPTDEERLIQSDAWAYYMSVKQVDVSPGLVVATSFIAYAGPRFGKPQTKKRLSHIGGRIKKKWRDMRGIRDVEENA